MTTLAGNLDSFDTARDVRGFATKFCTTEGNYDPNFHQIPIGGFTFELGKVKAPKVRQRMLGHLQLINLLGMVGRADKIKPAMEPTTSKPSKALSQYSKAPLSIEGRKIGLLTTYGLSDRIYNALLKQVKAEGAEVAVITPRAGPVMTDGDKEVIPDDFLAGAPSVMLDAVVIAPAEDQVESLFTEAAAINCTRDAFGHLKVIAYTPAAQPLIDKAGIVMDEGVIKLTGNDFSEFIT
jgi:catalase